MLNPQKRNLLLATIAVVALIGVIGVAVKKKKGAQDTATSTESSSEPGHALGTPDAPGTPHLSHPAQPGFEPGSEPSEGGDSTFARNDHRATPGSHGAKESDSAPALTLAMLSPTERARIQKEYPEFKNPAPRVRTAPGHDPSNNEQPKGKSKQGGDASSPEADVSLPKLTLAMLSPAERERVVKEYPDLFKDEKTASGSGVRSETGKGGGSNTSFVGPIPTKPGQPLVLLQPGMPGHPDTPVTVSKGSDVALAPKPEPAVDSCYTVTFHHKHPGAHSSDETCSHHKNLIRVHPAEGLKMNPKTVCIRVNGKPVKYTAVRGKPTDFVIGIVVGMDTAVTARYCTGKFRCNEDCKVPRDEFIESIAGSDMDTDESRKLEVAVWDKEDPNDKEANAKLAADMHKGLKDLDEVAKAAAEGYTLFDNWVPDQQSFACQNHQAQGATGADDDQATEKPRRKVASKR